MMIKRGEKGITLVALVITVIILLIIAGVAMSLITGQNGLFARANHAGYEYDRAAQEEKDKYDELDALLAQYAPDADVDDENEDGESMTLVAMYQKAVADGCTNADGTCTRTDHLHIGDYVNYTNPTSGRYLVPAGTLDNGTTGDQIYLASQNQLNWRVLGIEGTGNDAYIKLIAGSPMKKSNVDETGVDDSNPYLYMIGAKAYKNAIEQLNNICAICKNGTLATEAKSVTMDDIDKLTGVTTAELKQQKNLNYFMNAEYGEKNYGEAYSFDDQYDPDSWLATPRTTKKVEGTVDGYYYTINQAVGTGAPYVTMSNSRIYNMLFNNVEIGTGRAYWLASVGVCAYSDCAGFGPATVGVYDGVVGAGAYDMFYSDGGEGKGSLAVRPVVSLRSGVTNEQCAKIADQNDTTWNVAGGGLS